jgi:hypothetical protein
VDRTVDAGLATGIDQIFHFFFDDTNLSSDIDSCVGDFLLNSQEVAVIQPLLDLLNDMFREIGDSGSEQHLRHRSWSKLVEQATIAFNFISQAGMPKLKSRAYVPF